MITEISSTKNPKIKQLLQLQQKSKMRLQQKLFVAEGTREVQRALAAGYTMQQLFVPSGADLSFVDQYVDLQIFSCSLNVFSTITYRGNHANLLAVFEMKSQHIENFKLPKNPLLVVVEAVEKPGNLGAILRTCNGLGADAVLVCDSGVDVYNPNVIRNSLGGFFDIPIFELTSKNAIEYLQKHEIQIFAASLQGAVPYLAPNYVRATALAFGSEAHGLSAPWRMAATQNIIIPMQGLVDSLNVSVAAAIVLAEAKRQRHLV